MSQMQMTVSPILEIGHVITEKQRRGEPAVIRPVRFDLMNSPLFKAAGFRGYIGGSSGSGKTNLKALIAENVYDIGLPFIVIDAPGHHRSLTELGPGVYCIGNQQGDIELDYPSYNWLDAALALLERGAGIVLDLRGLPSDSDRRIAYTMLAKQVFRYQENVRRAMFFFVEEAHRFAPQKRVQDSEALNISVLIGREGRGNGINTVWASQRPRDLEADLAAQANVHFCGRIEMKLDYKAFEPYLDGSGVKLTDMMKLKAGQFYLRVGGDLLKVQVNERRTTHLGETPPIMAQQRTLFDLAEVLEEVRSGN